MPRSIAVYKIPGASFLKGWLKRHFDVEIVPDAEFMKAEYLLTCDNMDAERSFPGVCISVTMENHAPSLWGFDYCISHEYPQNDRCFRFPYWQYSLLAFPLYASFFEARQVPLTLEIFNAQNRRFCDFVCRNHVCRVRNDFVRQLSMREKVDCAGPWMNNTGSLLPKGLDAKIRYAAQHCFTVAYENEASPGYCTEKILDAFAGRSIPIYWGSATVEDEFNPRAFVHARRFADNRALINHILDLYHAPEEMLKMLNEPCFRNQNVIHEVEDYFLEIFSYIFEQAPRGCRRSRWERFNSVLSRYYGHGFFRTVRSISRRLRGKLPNNIET